MHFAVIGKHRDFFRKHGWIQFEELILPPQLERLNKEIEQTLTTRLKIPAHRRSPITPNMIYFGGYDVWRNSQGIKRHFLDKALAEIASELIEQKPLRFGYDQLIPAGWAPVTPMTLHQMSSIQDVLCGVLICLSPPKASTEVIPEIFPQKAGDATFFGPQAPLPFEQLPKDTEALYAMLVYVTPKAVYYMNDKDPHLHDFKQLGYNYGDRLKEVLNPIVYP